ncbi:discoidin domain-containing protein [Anaerospora sp.]|uniref:discoidin domain-containing protein n=1 Tax=Anaerospora sp. TaxID=1960278 RepID=UPI0028980DED|nr:discoidin domain-containing protein [Anaerospora sp.]
MARTVLRNSPNEILVQFDGNLRIAGNGGARGYGRIVSSDVSKFGPGSFYTSQEPILNSPPNYGQKDNPDPGWVRFDDNHPNIFYYSWNSWNPNTSSSMYGGTFHYSSYNPAILCFNFTGTKLRIICALGTGLAPTLFARVDGQMYSFTTYNLATQYKRVVFELTDLEPGEHYITIEKQGSSVVYFDAIDLEEGGELLPYRFLNSNRLNRVAITSPIFDFSKDFTLNYWEYCTYSPPWHAHISFASDTSGRNPPLELGYNNGSNATLVRMSTGSTGTNGYGDIALDLSSGQVYLNSWVNWEINRSGNTYRVFANGTLQRTFTSALVPQTCNAMWLNPADSYSGNYFIDEIYFISGTCLHTTNFTPETAPAYVDWSPIEISGRHMEDIILGDRPSISTEGSAIEDIFPGIKQAKNNVGIEIGTSPGIKSRNHIGNELPILSGGIRSRNHKAEHLPVPYHAIRLPSIFSGREIPIVERGIKSRNHSGITLDDDIPSIRLPHNFDGIPIEITPTSNAENKFNLTVTPTHLHKLPSVIISCESKSPIPLLGKCSLKIGNNDTINLNEDYEDVRHVTFTVTPSVLSTGNNLCRISYEYPDGESEHLDFEIFKEEPKRLQVERLFRYYEGGYTGERRNAIPKFSKIYPGFMVPEGQTSTLITTTQFTRIDLRKYLSIQGVNIDAKGARILVSFDEGQTWKTWGIVGRGALNTSKSIIPPLENNDYLAGEYIVTYSEQSSSWGSWGAFRIFDSKMYAASGVYFWLSTTVNFPKWIAIKMKKGKLVNGYSLIGYYQPERNPKSWRVEGSNNGTNWTVLDTRTNQVLNNSTKSNYSFENDTEYTNFRLVVTEISSGTTASIVEWELFEKTPIYGWKTVDLANIAEEGMSPEVINSRTIADWADVFKPKSIDFAIYLDDRLSTYYDLSLYPAAVVKSLSYYGQTDATFQSAAIPADKIVTTTYIQRYNNYSGGTQGSVIYADYSRLMAYPPESNNGYVEKPINIAKDVKYITLETPNVSGSGYAVGAQYDAYGTRRIAYLKSINVQITPNLKTGYAFII